MLGVLVPAEVAAVGDAHAIYAILHAVHLGDPAFSTCFGKQKHFLKNIKF